jgi:hypothetical protein
VISYRGGKQETCGAASRWTINTGNQDDAMSTGYWRIKPSQLERTLKSVRSVGSQTSEVLDRRRAVWRIAPRGMVRSLQ